MVLEEQVFNIRAAIEDSVEVVLMEIEQKDLDIVVDIDPAVPRLMIGDPGRFRQILLNLLSNAVKFSPAGEILVSATARDLGSEIYEIKTSVEDQGIGIADDAQKNLFQPFIQADSSMTRRYGGSGLGLCISKQLAELMGGNLWFVSKQGVGSTFSYTVKLKKSTSVSPRSLPNLDRLTIMIIDPNEKRRRIVSRNLRLLGLSPLLAASSQEALQYVKSHPRGEVDLILVDNREDSRAIHGLESISSKIVQTGITPKWDNWPFWKSPIRESNLIDQLLKFINHNCPSSTLKRSNGNGSHNLQILLAEDNLMNQKMIVRLLRNSGYSQIDAVENGKLAVEAVQKKKYDIILMDCMMPIMSGPEATSVIRNTIPIEQQPRAIIALTANVYEENRKECMNVGMSDVLTKPISICKLKALLSKYTQ